MSEISVWNALCMIYVLKDGEGGGAMAAQVNQDGGNHWAITHTASAPSQFPVDLGGMTNPLNKIGVLITF